MNRPRRRWRPTAPTDGRTLQRALLAKPTRWPGAFQRCGGCAADAAIAALSLTASESLPRAPRALGRHLSFAPSIPFLPILLSPTSRPIASHALELPYRSTSRRSSRRIGSTARTPSPGRPNRVVAHAADYRLVGPPARPTQPSSARSGLPTTTATMCSTSSRRPVRSR